MLAAAARSATAAGLNEVLLGGAILAGTAAIIAFVTVRRESLPPAVRTPAGDPPAAQRPDRAVAATAVSE